MREWTEREEQEMIDRAKAGDPQANYELSLWALQRAEEEPGEVRWNKLAAKCLVKSAQAGYAPAQKRMEQLLLQQKAKAEAAAKGEAGESAAFEEEEERPAPRPARRSETARAPEGSRTAPRRDAPASRTAREPAPASRTAREPASTARTGRQAPSAASRAAARRPVREQRTAYDVEEDEQEEEEEELRPRRASRSASRAPAPRERAARSSRVRDEDEEDGGRRSGGSFFANWGEAQWKRMEIICIAVCVVLAIVLAVMLLTGNKKDSAGGDGFVPAANVAGETGSTLPASYPDEATKAAIQAADLSQYPDESDYVTVPTTAVVGAAENLRLRKGPNSTFDELAQMPSNTRLEIFAKRSGWDLVRYNNTTWGWCSAEYLIEDATGTTPDAGGAAG